jgi:hypothetical protein
VKAFAQPLLTVFANEVIRWQRWCWFSGHYAAWSSSGIGFNPAAALGLLFCVS